MIVYNGSLELYINNKVFFFWNHFQLAECEAFRETGSICFIWKLRVCRPVCMLHRSCGSHEEKLHSVAPKHRPRAMCHPPEAKKPIGGTEAIHIYTRFSSSDGKQLLAVRNVWGWINRMNGLNYVIAGSEIISRKIDKSAAGKEKTPTTSSEGEWQVLSSMSNFHLPAYSTDIQIPGFTAITEIIFCTRTYVHTQTLTPVGR